VIRVPSKPERLPDRPEPGYDQMDLIQLTVARALTVPLFLALLFVAGDPLGGALVWLLGAGVLLTAIIFALTGSSIAMQVDWRIFTAGDLVMLGALMAASGGPTSQIAIIYYISPLIICLLYPVRIAAIVLVATMITFALVSIPFVADEPFSIESNEVQALLLVELSLAWIGSISLAAADAFERKRRRIQSLSETRQRVLAETLAAEDDARRRVAEMLHDDALQLLLAAGQDIDDADGDADGPLAAAGQKLHAAIKRLRETARGLDPASAEHGGLATGLDSVAERAAEMGGMEVDVRVDPAAAGQHDALLIALARELATNAAKHSRAETLSLRVANDDGRLTLEVADDGRGMDPGRPEVALAEGHIGFASCIERAEAAGGTLLVDSPEAGGTRVRVSLPQSAGGGGSSPSQKGLESDS
jgi:two-component system NarL family sensor kinase